MDELTNFADKKNKEMQASLSRDAREYKPISCPPIALLTDAAKAKLTSVYENIKARVRALLAEE